MTILDRVILTLKWRWHRMRAVPVVIDTADETDEIIRRLHEANARLIPGICFGKAGNEQ